MIFVSLKRTTFWLIPTILLFVIKASRNFEDSLKFLEKLKAFMHSTLALVFTFLENFTLNLALKFEGFQGKPSKYP